MRVCLIDLESKKVRDINTNFSKRFLGGKAIGFELFERYGNDNFIVFSVGFLTGLRMSGMARSEAVFKSPLTGFIADSSCGGFFGSELRKAGFLAIAIRGKAEKPSMIVIEGEDVRIENAEHLWGKDCFQTEDEIKRELGRKFQVACIGQAGENLVRFASIEHAKGREFGRCGGGAVLGSMKIKAIAVRGDRDVENDIKDYDNYLELKDELEEKIREGSKGLTTYGTPRIIHLVNETGALPSYYWRDGEFEIENISPETLKEKYYIRNKSCYSCAVACGKISKIDGEHVEGPEYETLFAFGPLCGIDDPKVILKANMLCDKFGMDTISAGNVIAYLFHVRSKSGRCSSSFGDGESLLNLLEKIAFRREIGDLLAEGVARVSKHFGIEGVHVKGLEPPAYDPRGLYGMALAYSVCYRGACHIKNAMYLPNLTGKLDRLKAEDQAETLVKLENLYGFTDSLVICRFVTLPVRGPLTDEDVVKLYSVVTGMKIDVKDAYKIGEEVINLARRLNLKLGLKKRDDYLPEFFFKNPLEKGNSKGYVVERKSFERMLDEYYKLRNWSL